MDNITAIIISLNGFQRLLSNKLPIEQTTEVLFDWDAIES